MTIYARLTELVLDPCLLIWCVTSDAPIIFLVTLSVKKTHPFSESEFIDLVKNVNIFI